MKILALVILLVMTRTTFAKPFVTDWLQSYSCDTNINAQLCKCDQEVFKVRFFIDEHKQTVFRQVELSEGDIHGPFKLSECSVADQANWYCDFHGVREAMANGRFSGTSNTTKPWCTK
jgi:hypothetical protein